jgi:hypothetical protein
LEIGTTGEVDVLARLPFQDADGLDDLAVGAHRHELGVGVSALLVVACK